MSVDNQFTATGAAIIGFQTNSASIDVGADIAGNSIGIKGTGNNGDGVFGQTASPFNPDPALEAAGVHGENSSDGPGVKGHSRQGDGVIGYTEGQSHAGVSAVNRGNGFGVWASGSPAGHFEGDIQVTGAISKSGGGFRIDHPLDPENKYLHHSFVESPDMKNLYDEVVRLDGNGEAVVELPEWFGALNQDFRYQLTAIGAAAPGLHVAEEVHRNRIKIGGGLPGMKVSWCVTGVRKDAWANANRIPVEERKTSGVRGGNRPVDRIMSAQEAVGDAQTLQVA
jgi:hypothetical protein